MLCVSGRFPEVLVYDALTLNEHSRIQGLTGRQNRFSTQVFLGNRDSSLLAVGGGASPYHIQILDVLSECRLGTLDVGGHSGEVCCLCYIRPRDSVSAPRLVSGGYGDSVVAVWNLEEMQLVCRLTPSTSFNYTLESAEEWGLSSVFVGGYPETPYEYDLEKQNRVRVFNRNSSWAVNGLAIDTARSLLYAGSSDKTAKFWDRLSPDHVGQLKLGNHAWSTRIVEDLNLVLVGLASGAVEVWDPRHTEAKLGSFAPMRGDVHVIERVSRTLFASGHGDGVALWDATKAGQVGGRWEAMKTVRTTSTAYGVAALRDGTEEKQDLKDELERISFVCELAVWTLVVHVHLGQGETEFSVFGCLVLA